MPSPETDAVDQFITDAMNRGVIPMHLAADLSQYLVEEWSGRPLGPASGGDPGFWDRLGTDDGGLPIHLPMGVNERGQGPENDSAAYAFICWCGDVECPLTLALGHAWASGKRQS